MMKWAYIWIALLCIMAEISVYAQDAHFINYQAVIRDASGNYVPNTNVAAVMKLSLDEAGQDVVYHEWHAIETNDYGVLNLKIGQGNPMMGNFNLLDWSKDYFVQIYLEPDGSIPGITYTTTVGVTPKSLYAEKAGNVPTSEEILADLDIARSNDTLFFSNGKHVKLPSIPEDADNQQLVITGNALSIEDGNTVLLSDNDATNETISLVDFSGSTLSFVESGQLYQVNLSSLINDADADSQNELQTISMTSDTIKLSNGGGFVILPEDKDQQTLSLSGTTLSLSNGNSVALPIPAVDLVDDADADPSNELQTLSLASDVLSLSQGGSTINLSMYMDNTDQQNISLSGNVLSIDNGNSIDLSGYMDNTDHQMLSISGNMLTISNGNSVSLPVDLVNDADADSTNELQLLTRNNYLLQLSNGGVVDLSDLIDDQTLSEVLTQGVDADGKDIINVDQLAIGTNTPNNAAAIEIASTTKAILLSRMTTAQRDLITPVEGMIIFNTQTDTFQGYISSGWVDMH